MNNAKVNVGDILKFGRYPQEKDPRKSAEEIAWRVLAVQGDSALIVSVMSLDAQPYHDGWADVTWEKCTLRSWLNDEFYKAAFNYWERAVIELTQVVNEDNPEYMTKGGNDTMDYVFLLSIAEMETYFKDKEDRVAKPTAYAIAKGARINRSRTGGWWWLRSPGRKRFEAAEVHPEGDAIVHGGTGAVYEGVRPALWINYIEYSQLVENEEEALPF